MFRCLLKTIYMIMKLIGAIIGKNILVSTVFNDVSKYIQFRYIYMLLYLF